MKLMLVFANRFIIVASFKCTLKSKTFSSECLFPWLSIGLIISKKSLARYSKLNFPFISASPKFPFAETSLPFPLLRELKERLPILIAVSGLEICKSDTFISPSKFLKSFPEKLAFSNAEKSVAEYPFDKFKACGANFFIAASI